jgi:hypothetical protein
VPAALGVILVASRVLPLDTPARGETEELCFVVALALCVAAALLTRAPRNTWVRQLAVASGCLMATPFLATLRSGAGLVGAGARIPEVLAVDCGLLALGVACGAVSLGLRQTHRVKRTHAAPLEASA